MTKTIQAWKIIKQFLLTIFYYLMLLHRKMIGKRMSEDEVETWYLVKRCYFGSPRVSFAWHLCSCQRDTGKLKKKSSLAQIYIHKFFIICNNIFSILTCKIIFC